MTAPTWLALARAQLAPYGYTLAPDGEIIGRSGRHTGVTVGWRRGRYSAGSDCTGIVWTGPDCGRFVAEYWFACKLHPAALAAHVTEDTSHA